MYPRKHSNTPNLTSHHQCKRNLRLFMRPPCHHRFLLSQCRQNLGRLHRIIRTIVQVFPTAIRASLRSPCRSIQLHKLIDTVFRALSVRRNRESLHSSLRHSTQATKRTMSGQWLPSLTCWHRHRCRIDRHAPFPSRKRLAHRRLSSGDPASMFHGQNWPIR